MASFNTVYSKGRDGSWKTKTDQKKDKLKEIFNDIAKLSGVQSTAEVRITPHNLIAAMKNQEQSKLLQYFGQKSSDELFKAFTRLDKAGNGAVTLEEFLKGAEAAFALSSAADDDAVGTGKTFDIHVAETLMSAQEKNATVSVIPQPPPMTREMLYRSVFNNCDGDNKGFVSVRDLLNAMKNKRSDLCKVFGPQRADKALAKFSVLDTTGTGRITFEEFYTGCEIAFTNHVSKYERKADDYSHAPAVLVKGKVPIAPPMNRHLLYSSVFKSIDTKGKGKISQKDLTRAMSQRRSSIAMIFGHQNTTHAMTIFSKLDEEDNGKYNVFANFFFPRMFATNSDATFLRVSFQALSTIQHLQKIARRRFLLMMKRTTLLCHILQRLQSVMYTLSQHPLQ